MTYALLMALCVFGGASAQIFSSGPCPKVETFSNYSLHRFRGPWYEAERYSTTFEIGTKCVKAQYHQNESETSVSLSRIWILTGISSLVKGTVYFPYSTEFATFKVTFPFGPICTESDYRVLGIDYTSFSVVYSCTNFIGGHTTKAWIFTRERIPAQSVIKKAYEIVKKNNLETSHFQKTNQENCHY